ncbi:MAG: hypothetical protein WBA71_01110 [Candidatus Humimicrobiia bacterium]
MKVSNILKVLIIIAVVLFILHYFVGLDNLISKLSDINLDFLTTKLKEFINILKNSLTWIKEFLSG